MECRSHCPINFTLESVGDKWSLLILRDLVFSKKRSYNEFLASEERISTNILADRLKSLEATGIIVKGPDPAHGSKYIYRLTPKGADLLPILVAMIEWGGKHDPQTAAPKAFLDRIKADRDGLLNELRRAIDEQTD